MNHFSKKLVVFSLLVTLLISVLIPSKGIEASTTKETWKWTAKGWSYFNSIKYPIGWTKDLKGNWYYFYKNKSKNIMASNEYVKGYYVNSNGKLTNKNKFNWKQKSDGSWIYTSKTKTVVGWAKINKKWYYFNSNGVMQTGMVIIDNKIYYANSDGVMKHIKLEYSKPYNITSNKTTRYNNARFNGIMETWYSNYEGGQYYRKRGVDFRTATYEGSGFFHIAEDGTIRDKDGYICIATNNSTDVKNRKIVMTSLGPAKVYDRSGGSRVDIYTNWR